MPATKIPETERKPKAVLIVAVDASGHVQKILRQITRSGTVLS